MDYLLERFGELKEEQFESEASTNAQVAMMQSVGGVASTVITHLFAA